MTPQLIKNCARSSRPTGSTHPGRRQDSRSDDTRGMFGGSNTHHNDQSGEAKWTQVALARHRLLACLQLCPLTLFLEPMCIGPALSAAAPFGFQ